MVIIRKPYDPPFSDYSDLLFWYVCFAQAKEFMFLFNAFEFYFGSYLSLRFFSKFVYINDPIVLCLNY